MQAQVKRSRVLALAFLAFIVVFVMWQTGDFFLSALILYPLRLFVTFVHETAHGLSAIVTGGAFVNFVVFPNGAGLAYTIGGSRFLILNMGYLGAALFGGALLVAANRVKRVNALAALLGVYVAGSALLFSGNGRLALFLGFGIAIVLWLLGEHYRKYSGPLWVLAWLAVIGTIALMLIEEDRGLVVGLIGGVALMGMAIFAPRQVIIFVLNVLAFVTGLNAFSDIWILTHFPPGVQSDAQALSNLTGTPTLVWVGIWAAFAVVIMLVAAYFAFLRGHEVVNQPAGT